ncbi:MAG: putative membrane protein [Candidatus Nitrotoga sp. MKT]|nr:MAG: putative membrane protein [Candidatus Nitrotoga sp. MKT]
MYLPTMVLSLSLLIAFNVLGAQNNNSPSPNLTTSTPINVPYQSSFSSYKPYVEEELSSWRALNEQVTGEGPTDHSMGNMKSMDHKRMESMPSGHSMPEMKGVQHDHVEPSTSETPMVPMKGMDHDSMKDMPPPTTQPSVKGVSRGPQQEILLAMNDEKMTSKHSSKPPIENMPHEHNETESSSFMTPMAAMDHGSMKDMPNDTGQPSSKESSEQAHQHRDEHAVSGGAGGATPLKINKTGPVIKFELIPNAHPIAVHFPIALTLIALLFSLAARIGSRHNLATQLATVGHWALWISGVTAIIAAGLGWLAFNSVDHDDSGHAAMLIHRNWAIPTAIGLLLLAMWDVFKSRAHEVMSWFTLIVLTLLSGSVAVTGWLGGEVVYRHGIGVLSLPEIATGSDSHGHDHGDSDSHRYQHGVSAVIEESKPAHQH